MKVLWFTNVALPEACESLGHSALPYGGWLESASTLLAAAPDVSLTVASHDQASHLGARFARFRGRDMEHIIFSRLDIATARSLIDSVSPDVVHLHGTEANHALPVARAAAEAGVAAVVSIQGLLTYIAEHYAAGVPASLTHVATPRNVLRRDWIAAAGRKYRRQGLHEREVLRSIGNVIGRTQWDMACVAQLDPTVAYSHCNESLRDAFYGPGWRIDAADRHSIFVSQGHYPLKGLHRVLQALPIIRAEYPDARLSVAGRIPAIRAAELPYAGTYDLYLKWLIAHLRLQDSVDFVGPLDAEHMRDRYLRSHVFVSASSVENSSNSIAEAMLLGLPVVSSFVGGVPDLMAHEVEGLMFPADAPYTLAAQVMRTFADDDLATRLGGAARRRASRTHDRIQNRDDLLDIYRRRIGAES